MKNKQIHTTNYINTLIEVAPDTKAISGRSPAQKTEKITIASLQFDLLINNPYAFTSDDLIFTVFAKRNELVPSEFTEARNHFFSKGQPCMRTSPLTKTYGFGIHANKEGLIALVGMETEQYQKLLQDSAVLKVKAMRNSRK